MLGEICYSCKLHLLDSQTGTLGVSGGQQSRWMLKAGNYFAKFFLSFCSLNENENKRHEMQEWGAGVQTEAGERGLLFSMQMSFCIGIVERQGDPLRAPTQTETAYFCSVWAKFKSELQETCCGRDSWSSVPAAPSRTTFQSLRPSSSSLALARPLTSSEHERHSAARRSRSGVPLARALGSDAAT